MNIALIGTRGVPAKYGGFETCAEEFGRRLVERGHKVTVYCRRSYYTEYPPSYLGMDLVFLPNLRAKSLDTLSHTFLSVLHALRRPYDVLMVFNAANAPALILPRILGKRIALNPDGLEWKRGKWGRTARLYYKFSEWLSSRLADRIVADSSAIQRYYREEYGVESSYIAYGAHVTRSTNPGLLAPLGLKPGEYFLQITRFEPENNPLLTVRAFKRLKTDKKLVLVGGATYRSAYSDEISRETNGAVILPGFVYDKELLNELWCNCYAYVHGNEVGGTNPALLQTMASGCFTIAVDVPFSRDVLGDSGIYYGKTVEELSGRMRWAIENKGSLGPYREKAVKRIMERYSWDSVAEDYERLFIGLSGGLSGGLPACEHPS